LQRRHTPRHSELQQTPSVHQPLAHSGGAPHGAPGPLRQYPSLHPWPAAQSAGTVHGTRHAPSAHTSDAHSCTPRLTQVPVPLHVLASVTVSASAQAWGAHSLPAGWSAQVPPAAQSPVLPHGEGRGSKQSSSGWPAGAILHLPLEQLMQRPPQNVSQQTESMHRSLAHSVGELHGAPRALRHSPGVSGSVPIAGRTGAAAVHVGLGAVPGAVVAGGHLADLQGADAAQAVGGEHAILAVRARGAGIAAAVDVGLGAVPGAVGAGRGQADRGLAHQRKAVGRHRAGAAVVAGGAWPAAVQVGLEAVLDQVVARRGLAEATGADQAPAIVRAAALQAVGARRTGGAAVHVGLEAVLDQVVARRSLAETAGAGQAQTVVRSSALQAVGARRAGPAAVHVGLGAVLLAVAAGRSLLPAAGDGQNRERRRNAQDACAHRAPPQESPL
jgi:hypothetical protein